MRLKQYLNEEQLYNKRLIENTITYDLYCKILDSDYTEIDNIIENCINESEASDDAKKRGLEYIGFGRYVHKDNKDTVKAIAKDGKLVDVDSSGKEIKKKKEDDEVEDEPKDDESDKIKIKNIAVKMKAHIGSIATDLKVSKDHIVQAFKQPKVYDVLKHFGFSIKSMATATKKTISTLNVGLKGTFEELSKTDALKKLRSGAIKVDEFLDKHPPLKKITGAAVGGFMVYQWLNMTFSGDVEDDYDLTNLHGALAGTYGMKDLLGTPNGLKGLVQLGIGLATGGGLGLWVSGVKGLSLALTYSGAKLAKNHDLANKIKDKMKSMGKAAGKKPIEGGVKI